MAYTILQYRDRLKKLTKDLNKAIKPPFRKGQKLMRDELIDEYWDSEFGERIWEWRKRKWGAEGGPAVKLGKGRKPKYPRWSASNQAYVAPINVTGLAAKIESGGGRLERHEFWGRSSRRPGVVVPRRPVFDRVIDKQWDRTVDDISKAFWQFVDRTAL